MVSWQPGDIAEPRPAPDSAVREAERVLRVRLPGDFLAVAAVHQGATPAPAKFDLPDGSISAVAHLLHFEPGFGNIVTRRFPVEPVLEKGIIPFAEDVGGDLLCFNYRNTPDNPSVVFWSVDGGSVELAPSFTVFVDALHA